MCPFLRPVMKPWSTEIPLDAVHLLVFSAHGEAIVSLAPGDELTLGVDGAGTLQSAGGLAALRVRRDDDAVRLTTVGDEPVLVNGHPAGSEALLSSGDVISVGGGAIMVQARPGKNAPLSTLDARQLRARLEEECERALRYGRPLAVVVVRLEGDAQQAAAAVASTAIRSVDRLGVGGARELVAILPETGAAAVIPAQRILEALGGAGAGVRAGVAVCPSDASDPEALLGGARLAAEAAGRGAVARVGEDATVVGVGDLTIVALDPRTRALLGVVQSLAATQLPVLIAGETGVGKDLLARALHAWSPRSARPLVAVNCAALADSLIEAELFGHERGAFTGAEAARVGLLESASGGTLFLDEISEASPRLQAELLRVLETGRMRRVGAVEERVVDLRVVAATNRELAEEVAAGRFRRDLFYRLNAALVQVPPLRERRLDIPELARRFVHAARERSGERPLLLGAELMQRLLVHDWPGNVRELKNVVDYVAAMARGPVADASELPPGLGEPSQRRTAEVPQGAPAPLAMEPRSFRRIGEEVRELERRRMREALAATRGVRARAAELIGMPLRTFATKLKAYGLSEARRGGGDEPTLAADV